LALNNARRAFPPTRAVSGDMEMNTQDTKLQAAENDMKELMADVARAMEKAQVAVARITSKGAAAAETESVNQRSKLTRDLERIPER
jgi:hypothetical protein